MRFHIFEIFGAFKLTSDILFYIFLPILLFESAYNINYRALIKNIRAVSTLAISSLIFSAFLTAIGLFFLLKILGIEMPFIVTLLFGSLISATDTAAALAIFKNLGIPDRLKLIFEGESLFNDGTAIALFVIVLSLVEQQSTTHIEMHNNFFLEKFEHFAGIFGVAYPYILV